MGGAGPPIAIEPQEPAACLVLPQGDRNPASAQKPGLAPVLDASTPNAILAIQTRLRALGYAAPLTRVWESATRDALRDFKIANHLDPSDVWDLSTQEQLASNSATPIARSFIGNWSISECRLERDQDAPLSINSRRARSSGGACEFLKISYSGPAWRIQALCQVDKERWSANITLTLGGNQLTWASERGIARYFRCN